MELPLETAGAQDQAGYAKAFDESFYRRQRELLTASLARAPKTIIDHRLAMPEAPVLDLRPLATGAASTGKEE